MWSSADGAHWECACEEAPWSRPHGRTNQHTVALGGAIYVLGGQNMPRSRSSYHSHDAEVPDAPMTFHADVWRCARARVATTTTDTRRCNRAWMSEFNSVLGLWPGALAGCQVGGRGPLGVHR